MKMIYKTRDRNHKEIVDGARAVGISVVDTADLGGGFPDTVMGWDGKTWLIEIKMPGEKLTPKEVEFFDTFKGAKAIVFSLEDVIRTVRNG